MYIVTILFYAILGGVLGTVIALLAVTGILHIVEKRHAKK